MSTETEKPIPENKTIGKQVTAAFENKQIDVSDLNTICTASGLSMDKVIELSELATNGEYKRVGKRITCFIDEGELVNWVFYLQFQQSLPKS